MLLLLLLLWDCFSLFSCHLGRLAYIPGKLRINCSGLSEGFDSAGVCGFVEHPGLQSRAQEGAVSHTFLLSRIGCVLCVYCCSTRPALRGTSVASQACAPCGSPPLPLLCLHLDGVVFGALGTAAAAAQEWCWLDTLCICIRGMR
jgi:hypothetical protein